MCLWRIRGLYFLSCIEESLYYDGDIFSLLLLVCYLVQIDVALFVYLRNGANLHLLPALVPLCAVYFHSEHFLCWFGLGRFIVFTQMNFISFFIIH